MIHSLKMPLIMGSLMGIMMLFMLHGMTTGERSTTGSAALVFIGAHLIGAHLAVVGFTFAIAVFGLSRYPRLAKIATKIHRPSRAHVTTMLGAALMTAFILHVFHGAP